MNRTVLRAAILSVICLTTALASAAVLVASGGVVENAGQVTTAGETTSSSGARVIYSSTATTLPGPSSSGAVIAPIIVPAEPQQPEPVGLDGFLIR